MKIRIIIGGLVSLAIGIDIWINKGGNLYGQPVPQYSGFILIVFGVYLILLGVFKRKQNKCEKKGSS